MAQAAPLSWQGFVDGDMFPLVVFLIVAALTLVVSVLAIQWRRVRVAETEGAIKMRMIEKGYSAEEIERVVRTTPPRRHERKHSCRDFIRGHVCA